jgi:sulfur dioxygenase
LLKFVSPSFNILFSVVIHDHPSDGMLLQTKLPGAKSVISKASGAKADRSVEHGEKIYFGNLFLEV